MPGRRRFLCGYSLAGLFALWAVYQTDFFAGTAAVSPSVWYPGWLGYAEEHRALTPAVYLSYLPTEAQGWVLEEMERSDCTPSVAQAYRLKEQSVKGGLTREYVAELLCQEKANQKERLKIPMERIRRFFPASYTSAQMEEEIVKMCEARYRKRATMER